MVRSKSPNLNPTAIPQSTNSMQIRTVTQTDHTKAIHPTLLTSRRSSKAKGNRLKRDDFGFKERVTIISRFHLVLNPNKPTSSTTITTTLSPISSISSICSLSSSTSSNASI
ncbi:hypothetical protein DFH28DRAFT_493582 [Melampsora americana]|nr:hypothetical protein DFH28DRAFT_493582 [Melampsora americana]